jgi:hypothetical protein
MRWIALLALAAAACVSTGKPVAEGVCPESQTVCLAGRDCARDRVRGCEVCMCRDVNAVSPPIAPGPGTGRPEGDPPTKLPPLK